MVGIVPRPPAAGVLVVDIEQVGTLILKKLQISERSTLTRFTREVLTGVTEQYKATAIRFCRNFATSAQYYAQSAHTTQCATSGKRKYGPNSTAEECILRHCKPKPSGT
jgi:hypothetical protein